MAPLAEQDNRVQITNGTAAVNAERIHLTKVSHWGDLGRLWICVGGSIPKPHGSRKNIGKSSEAKISACMKAWKPPEYFVYFKVYKLRSQAKRLIRRRRQYFRGCRKSMSQKNYGAVSPPTCES